MPNMDRIRIRYDEKQEEGGRDEGMKEEQQQGGGKRKFKSGWHGKSEGRMVDRELGRSIDRPVGQ